MVDATRKRIREIVEPEVTAEGYDLEDLKVSQTGRRILVRVLIDRDGGVDLDAIAGLSRTLSKALDAAESAKGPFSSSSYTLEVSSPGVDRPLKLPRHWRRNVGRLASVKAGDETLVGRIAAADDRGVRLELDSQTRTLSYDDLGPGRIQLEFSRSSGEKEKG
ncbi:MAG: ribosome maturation factor RimP [Stackebrandtia sp.]